MQPKGTIVLECGNAMLKNGYKVRILNTINFKKSMHYNPFSYVHSEKDILKLVTTLMTNTKGEGSGGDPFWEKSERLLLTALIAYLHYEAPVEEQNFATLLEMLITMQVLEDDEEYQNPVDLLFEELAKKKPNSLPGGSINFTSWLPERPQNPSSFPAVLGSPPSTSKNCGTSPCTMNCNWTRWAIRKRRCSSSCRTRIPPLISSSAWSTRSFSICFAIKQMMCTAANCQSMYDA